MDLPLETNETATLGISRLRVKARGVMGNKSVEETAAILYPWQQTGYLRGRTAEGLSRQRREAGSLALVGAVAGA